MGRQIERADFDAGQPPGTPGAPSGAEAREIRELRRRLEEAESTLDAIRSGQVTVPDRPGSGERVYTLEAADRQTPPRGVESEGALVLERRAAALPNAGWPASRLPNRACWASRGASVATTTPTLAAISSRRDVSGTATSQVRSDGTPCPAHS